MECGFIKSIQIILEMSSDEQCTATTAFWFTNKFVFALNMGYDIAWILCDCVCDYLSNIKYSDCKFLYFLVN